MGTNTCKCVLQNSEPPQPQLTTTSQLPLDKIKFTQNRIKTISSISTLSQHPNTNSKSKPQTLSLILHSHNQSFHIKPVEKIQTFGASQAENYQVTPQSEDDVFLLSIKYSSGAGRDGQGGYYARDEGVGLGCFYKLRQNQRVELRNRCLIGIGNVFILPMINQMSVSSSTNFKDLNAELKIFGGSSQGEIIKINSHSPGHFLIGNTPQCAIRLRDGSINGVCGILRKQDDELILSSYGSNDVWIYLSHTLKLEDDMILKCGTQYFKVEIS